ncbi:phosphoenolpyruvate carboxylase [Lacipirellula limnantheis]|uniref:Phosphoenolpyruvate carboxylase n=1 Tax=Lacipirellula limnantheis TaxID=2528024 RepID=A0A517TVN5_9BACT|nr:phosphoenolpyruvate carboxylase [Lacipirellula limnantheis]QDT72436.1 Phosphoenolpyruvate carboxylase [Lacipirellula limnantheis]
MAANGDSHSELRREIDELGRLFGATITRFAGDEGLELVERVRGLARLMREGNAEAGQALRSLLAQLDEARLKVVVRSFSIFLELANLAEDRQRIRTLQQREDASYPEPRKESIRDAIAAFKSRGLTASEVQTLVNRVAIELVLTAHPTEAKRRSLRRILRRIHQTLAERDVQQGQPRQLGRISRQLQSELEMLWQTDFIRPRRPTVLDEVARGLAFLPVLWEEAPALIDELRQALAENYPSVRLQHDPPLIRYGSWMGGDRDGNPFVTPDITRQTLQQLRTTAIDLHLETCGRLSKFLSISDRETPPPPDLVAAIARVGAAYPALAEELKAERPLESYRQWLHAIEWRLRRTAEVSLSAESTASPAGAYASAEELWTDVNVIAAALQATRNDNTEVVEVQPWLDQILLFGFHTERLDVRQHSGVYRAVIDELWREMGIVEPGAELDEAERCDRLLQTLGQPISATAPGRSPAAAETLELFALLRRVARRYGMGALGGHVVSMTEHPSDLVTVLWFWRASEAVDGGHRGDAQLLLPIVPLFETIGDLRGAAATFRALLEKPAYREHLRGLKNQQMIMIGYSDSTKDGGYVAAQWALFQAQIELQRIADEFGVTVTFFHGRGGALGRGGGPAARSILSLPTEAFSGSLRLTEQGEVLAERYDNPYIAHRHLEQVAWSTLTAASRRPRQTPTEWQDAMDQLGAESLAAYRRFVDHPAFAEYYRAATPINAIERLPIGSRPSKRKAGGRIEDLRAIPWVFSWTQNRCLIPAWFGIGSACESLTAADPNTVAVLANMYRKWSFFTAMIDNASLALAKANMTVFEQYAQLANGIDGAAELTATIIDEYQRSRQAILNISGSRELLDEVPWLQRSINIRNGYVDPLNMIQIELLQRCARAPEIPAELEHVTNLTVKGLSTGMRTTG